jgi:hypothetical protein
MRARMLAVTTLVAALAAAGACSGDARLPTLATGGGTSTGGLDTASNARIRLVNATPTILDLASNGVVAAGNAAIEFGEVSSCTPTNALQPSLTVRVGGTGVPIPGLATAYQSGVDYTVIAYTNSVGATQFATVADLFTPILGEAALRVFNGSAPGTSYDVYVTVPGASLDSTPPTFSNVLAGTFSSFGNASAGSPRQVRITFAGSKNILVDVGNTALIEGQVVTLVIVAPLAGSTRPRVFSAEGCGR